MRKPADFARRTRASFGPEEGTRVLAPVHRPFHQPNATTRGSSRTRFNKTNESKSDEDGFRDQFQAEYRADSGLDFAHEVHHLAGRGSSAVDYCECMFA